MSSLLQSLLSTELTATSKHVITTLYTLFIERTSTGKRAKRAAKYEQQVRESKQKLAISESSLVGFDYKACLLFQVLNLVRLKFSNGCSRKIWAELASIKSFNTWRHNNTNNNNNQQKNKYISVLDYQSTNRHTTSSNILHAEKWNEEKSQWFKQQSIGSQITKLFFNYQPKYE